MIKFDNNFSMDSVKNLHFVGIGGIGMSGIAHLLHAMGYKVSGSDLEKTEITIRLQKSGIKIKYGHSEKNIKNPDIVVISSAVKKDNPEVRKAFQKNIPVLPRALALSKIAELKKTITVSGSHGKTTTTSMIASCLESAGIDATVVVGGHFKNITSNVKFGKGEYFVAEADESDGSFLYFSPLIACVTNIDSDHLDYYKNMENLKNAFLKHISKIPFYGRAVLCADDEVLSSVFKNITVPYTTYGLHEKADWTAKNVVMNAGNTSYDAYFRNGKIGKVKIKTSGRHNVLNSLAALACGRFLGFDFKKLSLGLENFQGVKRRIEETGHVCGVTFIDDYGHHPTEINATLLTIKSIYKPKRFIVIFQPHRYTRTKLLHKEFGYAFKHADTVHVMDIYPAGEKPIKGVSSRMILDSIRKAGVQSAKFPGPMEIVRNIRNGDLLLTIGAGDVWKTGEEIKLKLEQYA